MKKKKYIEGGDVAAVGSLVSSVGMGNPYAMAAGIGLNLIGNFIENGSDPSGRTYNKNANPFGQMKYGGNVNAETINAEGGETYTSADNGNNIININGPKHEQGGVDLNLSGGTIKSDTWGYDKDGYPTTNPKKVKTTFAERDRKIDKKLQGKKGKIAENTKNMMLKQTEQDNSALKQITQMAETASMKYGGKVRKAENGLTNPGIPPGNSLLGIQMLMNQYGQLPNIMKQGIIGSVDSPGPVTTGTGELINPERQMVVNAKPFTQQEAMSVDPNHPYNPQTDLANVAEFGDPPTGSEDPAIVGDNTDLGLSSPVTLGSGTGYGVDYPYDDKFGPIKEGAKSKIKALIDKLMNKSEGEEGANNEEKDPGNLFPDETEGDRLTKAANIGNALFAFTEGITARPEKDPARLNSSNFRANYYNPNTARQQARTSLNSYLANRNSVNSGVDNARRLAGLTAYNRANQEINRNKFNYDNQVDMQRNQFNLSKGAFNARMLAQNDDLNARNRAQARNMRRSGVGTAAQSMANQGNYMNQQMTERMKISLLDDIYANYGISANSIPELMQKLKEGNMYKGKTE